MTVIDLKLPLPPKLSEKALSDNIVALARMLGYLVHRDPTWRATGADAGYPDLTLLGRGRLIFVELKSDKGKLTPAQEEWQTRIIALPRSVEYYVLRPEQWYAGMVEMILL